MKYIGLLVVVIFLAATVFGDMDDFSATQALLAQNLPRESLSDGQYELIGDYFMELIVGARHERMDIMLGGEGSTQLRDFHISLGKENYEQYQLDGSLPYWPTGAMMGQVATTNNRMMGGGTYSPMGFWGIWWIFGMLFMLTIAGLFAWLIFVLVNGGAKKLTAHDILKRRFAEGELTEKEYHERRKAIGG